MGNCCSNYKETHELVTKINSSSYSENDDNLKSRPKLTEKDYKYMLDPEDDENEFINTIDIIFYFLNDIRNRPFNYLEISKDYNLYDIFSNLKPSESLSLSKENLNEIKDYFYVPRNMAKTNKEKEKDIFKIVNNGYFNSVHIYQSISPTNDIKENVWQLLSKNKNNIKDILVTDHAYITIICQSLSARKKILVTYIFFDK